MIIQRAVRVVQTRTNRGSRNQIFRLTENRPPKGRLGLGAFMPRPHSRRRGQPRLTSPSRTRKRRLPTRQSGCFSPIEASGGATSEARSTAGAREQTIPRPAGIELGLPPLAAERSEPCSVDVKRLSRRLIVCY
jgi:hypothetical protein